MICSPITVLQLEKIVKQKARPLLTKGKLDVDMHVSELLKGNALMLKDNGIHFS